MIPFLLSLLLAHPVAQAEPYRFTGTLTAGTALDRSLSLRAGTDYGLRRHVAVAGEVGTSPQDSLLSAGLGLRLDPVDGRWWRAGLLLMPEVHLPPLPTLQAGPPRLVDHDLGLRAGLRLSYLVVWGVHLSARLDGSATLGQPLPQAEAAVGVALRL